VLALVGQELVVKQAPALVLASHSSELRPVVVIVASVQEASVQEASVQVAS
jgi:hypothetical protein